MSNLLKTIERKLLARRLRPHKDIDGFLAPIEAVGLCEYASKLGPDSTVVEIGSWKGKSTYCLAAGLKSGKVYAIDPFDASGEESSAGLYDTLKGEQPLLEQFKENMRNCGVLDKVQPMPGPSSKFVGEIKAVDLLFIDGDHSVEGCKYDYDHFEPDLKVGGYLLFHDYHPERKDLGPTWVIENQVIPSGRYEFCERMAALWIGRKIAT